MANWIQRFLAAITTHKDDVSAHHTAYTDDEADARVAFHADLETGVHGVGESTVCSETEADAKIAAIIVRELGDVLRNSNDTERTNVASDEDYTKIKEVLLDADLAECRLKFDIKKTLFIGAPSTHVKVYRNGLAIGVEHTAVEAYATFSEDFADWVKGDLIQLYAFNYYDEGTAEATTQVRNMRFYYIDKVETDPISATNQDP